MESTKQAPKEDRLQNLREKAYIPGMSIAIIADGKLSETIVLGVANTKLGTPVVPDTAFPVASLSKPVFAYLVFQLIEKGVLKSDFLDQPLYEILPEYQPFFADTTTKNIRFDDTDTGKAVTPRLILSHRTGLPNWIDPTKGKFQFPDKLTNKFDYSGEGYHFLQKAIEKITEKSLQELAFENVFTPLKMHHSSFSAPKEISKVATGHDEEMNPKPVSGEPRQNAGASLVTTPTDFGFFIVNLLEQTEKNPRFKEFMQAVTLVIKDEQTYESLSWTLGWGLQESKENVIEFHWGDVPNFKAFVAINPKNRSAIAIFTNSQNGMEVIQGTMNEVAPSIGNLAYSLDYLSKEHNYSHLNDTPGWQQRYEGLVAELQGEYPLALALFKEAQALNPKDKMTERHIEWLSNLLKIQENPVQIPTETLKQYEGRYGPLLITANNGQLQLQVGGQIHSLLTLANNTFLDIDDKVKLEFYLSKKLPTLSCQFLINDNKMELAFTPTVTTQSMFEPKEDFEQETKLQVTDEGMAKSVLGQDSNTAKNTRK